MNSKFLVLLALVAGAIAGLFIAVGDSYVYQAQSGYSGKWYWLFYQKEPNEEVFFNSMRRNESDVKLVGDFFIQSKIEEPVQSSLLPDDWDPFVAGLVIPLDDPSLGKYAVRLGDGKKVVYYPYSKFGNERVRELGGVWLAEPNARRHIPLAVVFIACLLLCFIPLVVASWGVKILWYFLLARISEIADVVIRGKG